MLAPGEYRVKRLRDKEVKRLKDRKERLPYFFTFLPLHLFTY